ncbi:hypothetical protein [Rhodococcus opacus]|uniref:hypothetical protein n=1 Tax=Rhodococcus opacus TaxID=37919 RepID=UPI001C452FD4|nr:hypothetical protein [Rhodococcus opacus]MBV6760387.1 hypothetical protein [Rhodococcus opacus]
MTTPHTTAAAKTTPMQRQTILQRTLMLLFKIGFVVFMLSGIVLVLIQAAGLLLGNAELTINTIPGLAETMTISAGLTGLLAFAMSYVFDWDTGGDD